MGMVLSFDNQRLPAHKGNFTGMLPCLLVLGLYMSSHAGALSGSVHRTDSSGIAIAGAKVVFLQGATRVDSVLTGSQGDYQRTLAAGTYTVQFKATGYKSPLGRSTCDTVFAVGAGAATLNVNLTPARSSITGTVTRTIPTSGPAGNTKVILGRRVTEDTADVAFLRLDSVLTDVNGVYRFDTLIAAGATTSDQPQSRYRLYVPIPKTSQMHSYPWGSQTNADTLSVAFGQTATRGITLLPCGIGSDCGDIMAIVDFGKSSQGIRFTLAGEHLAMNFPASASARLLSIVTAEGSIQYQTLVRPGQNRAMVPATLSPSKGFLYRMREASGPVRP